MANANIGITETTAASFAQVSNMVQTYLIQESLLLNKVSNYSALAVKGAASIKVPRSTGFSVADKSENTTALLSDTGALAADTITLNKHKYVQFLVEDYAEIESSVAAASIFVQNATKDIALQLDKDIIVALKAASASTPDHKIVYIDTSTDIIAKGDILAARKLLAIQNVPVRECFVAVSPAKEAELLALSDFIDASKFGSSEPIQNGVIGKIYGMPLMIHSGLTGDETLVWHPSAVGFAMQFAPRLQSEYTIKELGTTFSIDTKYGVATLDGGKRQVEILKTN